MQIALQLDHFILKEMGIVGQELKVAKRYGSSSLIFANLPSTSCINTNLFPTAQYRIQ
jgi:hypothetical protein